MCNNFSVYHGDLLACAIHAWCMQVLNIMGHVQHLCKRCWDGLTGDAWLVVIMAANALMAQLQSP